jgi:para-aminobenzoate synthetase component I
VNTGESTLRMRQVQPVGVETLPAPTVFPPGVPARCAGRIREVARLEWRLADGGDPAQLTGAFLAAYGLPVADLTRPVPDDHFTRPVCGAGLFVSAAAGARMAGGPTGAAGPIPAVPDLVAVVYEHAGAAGRGVRTRSAGPGADDPAHPVPGQPGWRIGAWRPSWTPERHAAAVAAVRDAIAHGDVYQVNVVGHAATGYVGDPGPALRRVTRLPGARYAGGLAGHGWAIACASPETLVELAGGRLVTRPIKGTRPATAAGRRELLGSDKERAEHIMIVDLERNDLARVARTGSVRVDELYAIRRWCDLWHAESVVSAALADGAGLADVLRALCPGGSVTGAPKLAALAQIAALEPVGRGPSMGALGWVGANRLDLGLTIRTVAVDARRLHVWAGGGITWGSDPAAEVAEAAAKAAPVRAALG